MATGFDRYFDARMKVPAFAEAYAEARREIDEVDSAVFTVAFPGVRTRFLVASDARAMAALERAGRRPAVLLAELEAVAAGVADATAPGQRRARLLEALRWLAGRDGLQLEVA